MLCLASGLLTVQIAATAFTLGWTHSIEKIRWEEDWRIERTGLVLAESRVRGSGAGMEPPAGGRLRAGVWHAPGGQRVDRLALSHSPYTEGYTLCIQGDCQPLASRFPNLPDIAVIELFPCPEAGQEAAR